jgi:hypothetical protein
MTDAPLMWRTSSFSSDSGTCVEMARRPDGQVLVRNSNHPDAGTLAFAPAELDGWLDACRTGALDDLTS